MQSGLSHASLSGPRVTDEGDLVWEQAGLFAPNAFCILSVRKHGKIFSWFAFTTGGLHFQLTDEAVYEIVDVSLIQPETPERAQWSLVRIRAVWKWEPEVGVAVVFFEDDSGARTVITPSDEPGTLSLLWRRGDA